MRRVAPAAFLCVLALLGCRRAGVDPIDPSRPDQLPACPSGPHLVLGLRSASTEVEQAVLRFTPELAQCAGLVLAERQFGALRVVGGLPDGTDLVGFAPASRGGAVVRFDARAELGRVEDADYQPISVAALTFGGQPAFGVVWGDARSSSDSGERLDVYGSADMARLGSWDVSYELVRVAAAPSGQPDRLAGAVGNGLQELRSDPGGIALATTGELQVAAPNNVGYLRGLDVSGTLARAVVRGGVLSWSTGRAPAFLGPTHCRWPDTLDTPLPVEAAEHLSAAIDLSTSEDTLVVIDGMLDDGGDERSHLFRMRPRGECRRIASIASRYRALGVAWAGR